MKETLRAIAAKYKEDIVRTAAELIRINSQSLQEGEVAAYIRKKMEALGYDEVTVDRYGSVFGTVRGAGGGCSVTLNCHMDVVDAGDPARWKHPPYGGVIEEGRIWGRGASDTKGTMAIQLYTPILLREAGLLPKGDVVTSCVIAEEIAGFGTMAQTRENRMLTDYAVIGEATENNLSIGSRGRCCAVVTITGKSCHASRPDLGANPFDYLGRLLPELAKVEMGSDELFGKSSMCVTKIESSEKGTNVIPGQVTVYLDYRQTGEDTEDVVQAKIQAALDRCGEVPGVTAKAEILYFPLTTYTGVEDRGYQGEYPFLVREDDPHVVQAKAAIEEAVGHPIGVKAWDLATDTGHLAAKGVKCLGYSPAEERLCHTVEGSISIEMMEEGVVGYLALTAALANNPKQ